MKNNKGFGLVEALIAAGILSVISIGLMKTFEISFNSANLMNSLYVTQDLRTVVTQTLNSGLQCENNLKSSNLISYVGAGDTRKVEVLKKFRSAGDTTGTELVRSGERFRDYLDIVAMRLEEPDTDLVFNNDVHKIFSIYYKLGRVRKFRTRDQKPCTEADTSGCYVNKCNLEYDLSDPLNPRCDLLDCFSESDKRVSVAGMGCSGHQYLSGYDSAGRAECKDLPKCADNEYFEGFDSNGDKICRQLTVYLGQSIGECPSGEYLAGFNTSGDKVCYTVAAGERGEPGEPGESIEPPRVPGVINSAPAVIFGCSWVDNINHGRICVCPSGGHHSNIRYRLIGNMCHGCPDGSAYYNQQCHTCSGSGTPVNGVCVLR